jgi:two-component system chemotaxis response regulator CheY
MFKALVIEDDFTSRMILQEQLKKYANTFVAVNGNEGLEAVKSSLEGGEKYDLICLDILMPELDGLEALKLIREFESAKGFPYGQGAKIIMTTSMDKVKNVADAYGSLCDGYLVKPIELESLEAELAKQGLITI